MKGIGFETFSFCGTGKSNEDYILCRRLHDGFIAILADGMGGLSHGADAARTVSESIMSAILGNVEESLPEEVLRMAFDAADASIGMKCRELRCRMGAAVTVVLVIDDFLYYAWQGNVRLYKVVDNTDLLLLTEDHTVSEGECTFLTRCVNGKGFRDDVPIGREKLEHSERIYLCSDGCYRNVVLNMLVNHRDIGTVSDGAFDDDASWVEMRIWC